MKKYICLLLISLVNISCVKNGYTELQDKKIDNLNDRVNRLEQKIEKLEDSDYKVYKSENNKSDSIITKVHKNN